MLWLARLGRVSWGDRVSWLGRVWHEAVMLDMRSTSERAADAGAERGRQWGWVCGRPETVRRGEGKRSRGTVSFSPQRALSLHHASAPALPAGP